MEHRPDQLHIAPAAAGEYSLEEILKEFSPEESPPVPTPSAPSQPKDSLSDTQVFTPVADPVEETPPPDPPPTEVVEETVKIFQSSKDVKVKPAKGSLPPIRILDTPPAEESPSESDDSHSEAEDPPLLEEDSPLGLLRKTHKTLSKLLVQRVVLAIAALSGMFLLLYQSKGWDFLPLLNDHIPTAGLVLLVSGIVLSYPVFLPQ